MAQFGPRPVLTGLITVVFSSPSLKNWKDLDCGPGKTSPVHQFYLVLRTGPLSILFYQRKRLV